MMFKVGKALTLGEASADATEGRGRPWGATGVLSVPVEGHTSVLTL